MSGDDDQCDATSRPGRIGHRGAGSAAPTARQVSVLPTRRTPPARRGAPGQSADHGRRFGRLAGHPGRGRPRGARRQPVQRGHPQGVQPDPGDTGGGQAASAGPGVLHPRRPAAPHALPQDAHGPVHDAPGPRPGAADRGDRDRAPRRDRGRRRACRPGPGLRSADPLAGHLRAARRPLRRARPVPDADRGDAAHRRHPDGDRDVRLEPAPVSGRPGRHETRRAGRRPDLRPDPRLGRRPADRRGD